MLVAAGDDDHEVERLRLEHAAIIVVRPAPEPGNGFLARGGIHIADGGQVESFVFFDGTGVQGAAAATITQNGCANGAHDRLYETMLLLCCVE